MGFVLAHAAGTLDRLPDEVERPDSGEGGPAQVAAKSNLDLSKLLRRHESTPKC